MREINQAWQVLSDAGARQHYDLELSLARIKAQREAGSSRPSYATVRPRPAPTPPPFDDDADLVDVAPSYGVWTAIFRAVPWLLVIVVLGGIFVFTAFAASHNSGGSNQPVTQPTAHVGDCIRWIGARELGVVDCNKANDGKLVDKVAVGQTCRVGTAPAYLPDERMYACISS
jgi:curved DNA-binding protein CbpA